MPRLYKYMPMSTLLKFMQDPSLRITPCHCQNDPFEFGFSKNDIEQLNSLAPERAIGSHIKNFSQRHGVIALSSDYENICMWAHYADNHKGAVVEILVDESDPFSSFLFPNYVFTRTSSDLHFDNVNYARSRSLDDVIRLPAEKIRLHYYFTKYERWSPESEYRFIVPFDAVNKIVCTKSVVEELKRITGDNCDFFYAMSGKEPQMYVVQGVQLEALTMDTGKFAILEALWNLSNGTNVMFFARLARGVSSGSIGRICFGVNANLTEFMKNIENSSVEAIYKNYVNFLDGSLHSLFQATVDVNSYKLKFTPITRRQFGPDTDFYS